MVNVREYTNKLLEGLEEGYFDKDNVILAFCKYMSEDDVKEMMIINELIDEGDEEDE
jgi:hypothetical protein